MESATKNGRTSPKNYQGTGSLMENPNVVRITPPAPVRREDNVLELIDDSTFPQTCSGSDDSTFLENRIYPKEYLKTLLAIVLIILGAFANGLVIGYVHQLIDFNVEPLGDVIHRLIPVQAWAWKPANVMVLLCFAMCVLVLIVHKHNSIVIRRMALLGALLYFMRALFLLCTNLPPSMPNFRERCMTQWNISDDPLKYLSAVATLVFGFGSRSGSGKHLCGDTIYSGHTLATVLTAMFVWRYCPKPLRPLVPIIVILCAIFSVITVIISRLHYTIDCVIAIFVTVSIVKGYHVWCRQRRDQLVCNYNRRNFQCRPVYAVFLFFERHVPPGIIPNELAWPLARPKVMVDWFEKRNARE